MVKRKMLGQILKEAGKIDEGQIQECLAIQNERGGPIGAILIEMGYITEKDLLEAIGIQFNMPTILLDEIEVPSDVIDMVSPTSAKLYRIFPFEYKNNILTIAMADPLNVTVIDELKFLLNCEIRCAVSSERQIDNAIEKYYGEMQESIESMLEELEKTYETADEYKGYETSESTVDIESIEKMAHDAPVVRLLNLILYQAINDKASDIHFEPFEDEFKIRYRVDGSLLEVAPPPKKLALPLISRIKVISNLNISETRLPQDGRIPLVISGRPVDIRVSTLPTMFGESVVMRILDRQNVSLSLENLGLREKEKEKIRELIELPNGIVIVTGPTGSGKTTTLYSCLNYLNNLESKIITTENPVEYDLAGIMQCQINEDIGVTYAACLRSILRQDPDIILVGEIRDYETADTAIEASLTGHLVLTTLHTNDAPQAIIRLVDIGIEPFLIAATMEAVIAQRLLRKICENCKVEYIPNEEELLELNLTPDDIKGKVFYMGEGCEKCHNTGYKGRLGIFEIMLITDEIKEMIIEGASIEQIRLKAVEQGMTSLRESGLLAIYDGHTTIEQVIRETLFAG